MKKTVIVGAPCKVNLSLDITGVQEDGYHLLRSVMQTVDLFDYLILGPGEFPGIFIDCDREQLICDTTNTAYRAARLFFEHTGIKDPAVHIEIIKNIPMQAGLGGGSSDAAAALVGLNHLYQTNLSMEELCELGVRVGADVPFCLRGGTMLCEGVGDIFTDLPALPECFILIAKPDTGISTPDSFKRYDRAGGKLHPNTEQIMATILSGNLPDLGREMYNVLEEVCELPQVELYKNIMLQCGALGAVMTGSGSAVIGLFDNKRAVRHVHRKLLTHADAVFITRPVPYGARAVDGKK